MYKLILEDPLGQKVVLDKDCKIRSMYMYIHIYVYNVKFVDVKVEALPFKRSPDKLFHDFFSQSYSSRKVDNFSGTM